jgi:hypothetical protein
MPNTQQYSEAITSCGAVLVSINNERLVKQAAYSFFLVEPGLPYNEIPYASTSPF